MAEITRATEAMLPELLAMCAPVVEAPPWSEAVWRETLLGEASRRVVLVASRAGTAMGFIVVSRVGELAEIENVVVHTDERRAGIGSDLCRAAMEWARDQGATTVELEVRAANTAPQQLYARLGFEPQGRRARYYIAPVDDAVLMAAKLS